MSAAETERATVEADARLAAIYLRTLIDNHVNDAAAIDLTKSYIQIQLFARINKAPPKEPWET